MRKSSVKFLKDLVTAPSPSGYEGPVRSVWTAEAGRHADSVTVDVHGNAIAVLNGGATPRIMLAGHMDELGFQILHIADSGFLHFDTVGGFDLGTISGRKVRIHTKRGTILGVVGKKPIHLMRSEERRKVPEKHEMWIDIGARDAKEARKLVSIGDPVTYDPSFEMLRRNLATSRGFDNKMGAFIVAETMREVARAKEPLRAALYSVATVQEEVGLRGAQTSTYGINPLVGIALDVTCATDHPEVDKRQVGDLALGKGPVIARGANVNPVVFERLIGIAEKRKIPHQIQAEPGATGTDANAMQLSRSGVATGLVGVALRYMHTPVEVIDLRDLEHTIELLSQFVLAVDDKTRFIP